jgi:hypothetical protein
VFDACAALHTGGALEALFPGHRVQAARISGEFMLVVDDAVCCEGGAYEVAVMFVTVRRALSDRAGPAARPGSHTRLRALSNAPTVPAAVPAVKRR